jgi:hypothetical protein
MTESTISHNGPFNETTTDEPGEKRFAPDAACFPNNEFWIPEMGNCLFMVGRHEKPLNLNYDDTVLFDIYDPELSDEGREHGIQTAQRIFTEIGYLPQPREYTFHYTNRARTEQTNNIIFQKISLDDPSSHTIIERGVESRLSTANQLNPIIRQFKGPTPSVIPTYLNMTDSVLEQLGSRSKADTLRGIIEYFAEKNDQAQSQMNDFAMHVFFVTTHETTFALLANQFFPEQDPQAEYGELMGITTGNPDNLATLSWRGLPPRVVSLR